MLGDLLTQQPEAALVVLDPITAYLSSVDTHVNADVRALLAPLGELAARYSVAIVCVSHLNKGGANRGTAAEALMRVSGSLAFVAEGGLRASDALTGELRERIRSERQKIAGESSTGRYATADEAAELRRLMT